MGTERQHPAISGEAVPPVAADGTMRAIVQDGYGSAGVLRLARIARPEIGGHDVLLRVHAAGLDRGTWHLMPASRICCARWPGSAHHATQYPGLT